MWFTQWSSWGTTIWDKSMATYAKWFGDHLFQNRSHPAFRTTSLYSPGGHSLNLTAGTLNKIPKRTTIYSASRHQWTFVPALLVSRTKWGYFTWSFNTFWRAKIMKKQSNLTQVRRSTSSCILRTGETWICASSKEIGANRRESVICFHPKKPCKTLKVTT